MATFYRYVLAAAAYGLWIIGYAIIQLVNSEVIPMAASLDEHGLVSAPLSWLYALEQYWLHLGLIGLLIGLVAVGVSRSRRGY